MYAIPVLLAGSAWKSICGLIAFVYYGTCHESEFVSVLRGEISSQGKA